MTSDQILTLAHHHGFHNAFLNAHMIEPFFKAAFNAGAAAEREECAKVCDDFDACAPKHIASAIRARRQK